MPHQTKVHTTTTGSKEASATGSELRDAALLCKDWGLDRWYTKYLFDQAIRSRERIKAAQQKNDDESLDAEETELLRACCSDLAPFLENPALMVGLLSSSLASSQDLINKQLSIFLKSIQPPQSSSKSTFSLVLCPSPLLMPRAESREAVRNGLAIAV